MDGLVVWFNANPSCMASTSMAPWRCCSAGKAAAGQLKLNGKDVNWRVRKRMRACC
jgi:hypothetical protein